MDIPNSCDNLDTCQDMTSFPVEGISTWTAGGGLYTQAYYSGHVPPPECGSGCDIESSRVRILFWPVDMNDTNTHNILESAETVPYTTVSDGFTL